jgi:hypothetical protein
VNGRAILSMWQQEWGRLAEPWPERFLARAQVKELTGLADEPVRMAIRAHRKLVDEVAHARWVGGGRAGTAPCRCVVEDDDENDDGTAAAHALTIGPGPATRVGGRSPSSATLLAHCRCGWELRGTDAALLTAHWNWHKDGEDEQPVDDY